MKEEALIFVGGLVAGAGLYKAGEALYNHFKPEEIEPEADDFDEADVPTDEAPATDEEDKPESSEK